MEDSMGMLLDLYLYSSQKSINQDHTDRVFAQALATIRALSNPKIIPASPVIQRPPIQDRIHLYGLYKQATGKLIF